VPANLLILLGPPAVGKMTIGQTIAAHTGYKLFHNHMAIECVLPIFSPGTQQFTATVTSIRSQILETFSRSDESGIIFTFVLARTYDVGTVRLREWAELFTRRGGRVMLAELAAPLSVRLERNQTPNRLAHKSSKRNLLLSERLLLESESAYHYDQRAGEHLHGPWQYTHLNTANLSPEDAADHIIRQFNL